MVIMSHLVIIIIVILYPAYLHGYSVNGVAGNSTLTIAYLWPWTHIWPVGPTTGSTIILALREVERRQLLPGFNIEWYMKDSWCEANHGFKVAVEIWDEVDDLDAIIGPGCSVACQYVGLLAAAWKIPMVSPSCASEFLSDKDVFPTFTRSTGSGTHSYGPVFAKLCEIFDWHHIAIVSSSDPSYAPTADYLKAYFDKTGKTTTLRVLESVFINDEIDDSKFERQKEVVNELRSIAHTMILFLYPRDARAFLITAYEYGMLNSGKYAFLTSEMVSMIDYKENYHPELDDIIYTGVITVDVAKNSGAEYDTFAREVIESFQHPAFDGYEHLSLNSSVDEVGAYAGNFLINIL